MLAIAVCYAKSQQISWNQNGTIKNCIASATWTVFARCTTIVLSWRVL